MTRDHDERRAELIKWAMRTLARDPVHCWHCLLEWALLGGTSEDLN